MAGPSSHYPGGLGLVSGCKAENQLTGGPWANYRRGQPGLDGMSCGAGPRGWPVTPEMWTPFQKAVVGLLSDSYDCGLWGARAGNHSPRSPPTDCDLKPPDKKVLQTAQPATRATCRLRAPVQQDPRPSCLESRLGDARPVILLP